MKKETKRKISESLKGRSKSRDVEMFGLDKPMPKTREAAALEIDAIFADKEHPYHHSFFAGPGITLRSRAQERVTKLFEIRSKMQCKDCGWWKIIEEGAPFNGVEKGRCQGRAPTVTAVVMPQVNQIANTVTPQIVEVTVWPVTPSTCEACGDFKEAVKKKMKSGCQSKAVNSGLPNHV